MLPGQYAHAIVLRALSAVPTLLCSIAAATPSAAACTAPTLSTTASAPTQRSSWLPGPSTAAAIPTPRTARALAASTADPWPTFSFTAAAFTAFTTTFTPTA